MSHWVPELLSPAGSLEKLKVSVLYGADAVYLGGQKFGLRQASDNFTIEELIEGVEFAHSRNRQMNPRLTHVMEWFKTHPYYISST